jgi:hypothetical protein
MFRIGAQVPLSAIQISIRALPRQLESKLDFLSR